MKRNGKIKSKNRNFHLWFLSDHRTQKIWRYGTHYGFEMTFCPWRRTGKREEGVGERLRNIFGRIIQRRSFEAILNLYHVQYCLPWPPRTINLRSTDSTVGGARAWAVLLAKTSRRAVPTAIMPIIAGGRLYKCLYKMHVDSRAFWGAFWGAFRVFLIDVGWGENKMAAMAPWNPRLLRNRQLCVGNKTLKKNILAVRCFVDQWYPFYTALDRLDMTRVNTVLRFPVLRFSVLRY